MATSPKSFELDQPLWQQYLNFWRGLLQGDLGPSIAFVGSPSAS